MVAAMLPLEYVDSVGSAAYWYKKDSRGRGDGISEEAKPKRFPAFALAADTFVVADPAVRAKHLDKVELWFGDKRYPAAEIARGEDPDTVTIKTGRPVEGVKPLAFVKGDGVKRLNWKWLGDRLAIEPYGIGTNSDIKVYAETRRAYHAGKGNSLILDKDGKPVALDFGETTLVDGDRFTYGEFKAGALPADSFETAAEAMEKKFAAATLPITLKFEQEEKENRGRRRWRYSDEEAPNSEADALGLVIDGKVLVPTALGGEDIARLKSAEATFADGTKTNLVFAGALAEWKAVVFELSEGSAEKVGSISLCRDKPHGLFGARAWWMTIENEGGMPLADAQRTRFNGVDFLRGAKFAADAGGDRYESYHDDEKINVKCLVDAEGRIASFSLKRRYGARYEYRMSKLNPDDLADALAGKAYNPEFRPRSEAERNQIVWLGVESVQLTDALAREKNAQSFCERYSRLALVTEVYPGSPCAKAGVKTGDVLLAYRRGSDREQRITADYDYSGRDWSEYFGNDEFFSFFGITGTPWTDVENDMNKELSKFGVGAKLTLVYVRDGKRNETEITLEAAPPHYKNAPKSRNRALGTLVKDMTFEVRRFFKFDDQAPGVVIAKIKPGSPAAVAGLKVFELITEVNGEKVTSAKDFAAKIKDRKDLVFAVRRLSQTRMVKIHVQ